VRFDSARAAGLSEDKVDQIVDGYEQVLSPAETAALQLTDAIIGRPQSLSDESRQALKANYSDAEIVEMALGVGMFMGMSKVLINLGLEPEQMPVTVVPTPGGGR
jgi:alkylhydroperoxidase family enzyme